MWIQLVIGLYKAHSLVKYTLVEVGSLSEAVFFLHELGAMVFNEAKEFCPQIGRGLINSLFSIGVNQPILVEVVYAHLGQYNLRGKL